MSDEQRRPADQALQFDRVMTDLPASVVPSATPSATCTLCSTSLQSEYYSVNGHTVCDRCRQTLEATAETPSGAGPLVRAGLFGLGAGVLGAAIYYAVIALANLEIGIVAILIGWMVGYAVHVGAGNRGGRRFQILAVALTYGAVALAYTPLMFSAAMDQEKEAQAQNVSKSSTAEPASLQAAAEPPTTESGFVVSVVVLLGFIAALPVLMVVGSLPSGLISAAIIFFGMQQAWKMTGAPSLQVLGPFRVGSESTSLPA